jgi:hypothetical protein
MDGGEMNRRVFLAAIVQSITIPRTSYPRAKIEAELIEKLRADVENLHNDLVDWNLRKDINHLIAELSKEY